MRVLRVINHLELKLGYTSIMYTLWFVMDGADKAEDFLQIDHFTALLRVSLRLETPIIWSFYAAENCQKSNAAGVAFLSNICWIWPQWRQVKKNVVTTNK